ncbi:Transcriptional regulatory protein ZraR [Gimesia alba]|uniref:Transcriptional regulatory protein ZraR n=1 Tax=Gimesia alba TaxID=2527973 RepID=A0A517RMQ0_9PLAN|nr:sigma-54 dependent transcriptional regulator [Gimesia alba]QDT45161.1 Transcriptional regulatory protein ZraR [Gimesia alba]
MRSNKTVLVIDDDLSIGRFIRDFIFKDGKRVLFASNAKQGLEHLEYNQVDVLFIDLHLPDEGGLNVIQKALQIHPNIASVVVTGFGSLKSAIEAMRLGACDYITKPFNQQQIINSLNRALNQINISPMRQRSLLTLKGKLSQEKFVFVSKTMTEVISKVKKHSHLDVPVLIQGEIGVGKRTLAKFIHNLSPFAEGPFFHINCAAIIENNHGHDQQKSNLFDSLQSKELPNKSQVRTLFLEDIEQLPKCQQKQLLKLLKEGRIRTPWNASSRTSSTRLIASTSANLELEIATNQFHRNLYDNLNVLPINIPPLCDRQEDIIPLASYILEELSHSWNLNYEECRQRIGKDVWKQLLNYKWPGNVQELASVLSRLVLLEDDMILTKQFKSTQNLAQNKEAICVPFIGDLKSMERHMINEVVKRFGGNKAAAARKLEMHRKTLYRILDNEK